MSNIRVIWKSLPEILYGDVIRTPDGLTIPGSITTLIRICTAALELPQQLRQIHFDFKKFQDPRNYERGIDIGRMEFSTAYDPLNQKGKGAVGLIRMIGDGPMQSTYEGTTEALGVQFELGGLAGRVPDDFRENPIDYARYVATALTPLLGTPGTILERTDQYPMGKEIPFNPYEFDKEA